MHSSLQAVAPTQASVAPLKALVQAIVLASGWRRALIAFAAGAASVLALAPTHIWPILFLTFPVLVWLVDGADPLPRLPGRDREGAHRKIRDTYPLPTPPPQAGEGVDRVGDADLAPNAFDAAGGRARAVWVAAVTGWWFGFGYLLLGLYWVGHAFLVDAKTFGWLLPFAVVALPAAMALYTALGLALARLIWTRGATRILALAAALTVAEWLRGHAFTGFPWNVFGYALTSPLELAQSAALTGLWGLTFIAVAVFASPATLIDDRADTRRPWLPFTCALLALAMLALFGTVRLARHPTSFVEGVRLRIMQPNLQQDEKFSYGAKAEVVSRYLALSARASAARPRGLGDVTHLVWPESPFPFLLTREPDVLAQIAALLPADTLLITGADRADAPPPSPPPQAGEGQGGGASARFYNSIYVIDHRGAVRARYDKLHLVPFGEFLPFQRLLERLGLLQLTKIEGGFRPGDRREPIAVAPAPSMLPLLCYEIIFPGEAVPAGERPGWLLNLTNDGWFGISTGPYQHFQQARVRAIEEGLPLVRAANTGISAVVDPLGRIVRALPLGHEDVLDAPLPQRVAPTPYARAGDAFAALLVALAFAVVVRRRLRPHDDRV